MTPTCVFTKVQPWCSKDKVSINVRHTGKDLVFQQQAQNNLDVCVYMASGLKTLMISHKELSFHCKRMLLVIK